MTPIPEPHCGECHRPRPADAPRIPTESPPYEGFPETEADMRWRPHCNWLCDNCGSHNPEP